MNCKERLYLHMIMIKNLLITAMLFSLLGCGDANGIKPEDTFKYYEYGSSTMRSYPYEYYRLEYNADNVLTLAWARNSSSVTVIRVSEDVAREIAALVNQYRLYNLKDSYRPSVRILDGMMWHTYFTIGDKHISCSGENAWPPTRQKTGIEAVNAYFGTLIEAAREEDILEVKDFRSR